jgi:hypothetical protein
MKPQNEQPYIGPNKSGVPLPGRKHGAITELGRRLQGLPVGEHFETSINRNNIYSHARYYGISVSCRTLANGNLGVWRIK